MEQVSPPSETNWYDAAEWYDIAFGWDASDEVAALSRIFAAWASRPVRRVYEPFCGSGRLTLPLASAGYEVVGADVSPAMIALAERKSAGAGLRIGHHVADVRTWSPEGPIDAVVTLIDSFRHLTDEGDARAALARWGRDVGPGGVVVIGIDLEDESGGGPGAAEWSMNRGGVTVHTRVEGRPAPDAALSLMHAVMTVTPADGPVRHLESTQPMRRYTLRSFTGMAERASLRVVRCTAWTALREDQPAEQGQVVLSLVPR